MRILWVGDAIAKTGFSRCTHAACDALHDAGHEVDVLGINYDGDPHDRPYRIWPCVSRADRAHDGWGLQRLRPLVQRLRPDVVVILQDPWNVEPYIDALEGLEPRPLVVGWLAVDGHNQQAAPLNRLDHVMVWTDFAEQELRKGGYVGSLSVVPLGVDQTYAPVDRAQARRAIFGELAETIGEDWIVGYVGRNQARKRLDLLIHAFALWTRTFDREAWLYLHSAPTGESSMDLTALARYHGVAGRVVISQPIRLGEGFAETGMPAVYSALNVFATTSEAEGWGLPALEAMACGIPCVLPDNSAFGSWAREDALLYGCSGTAMTAPANGSMHVVCDVPDPMGCALALEEVYRDGSKREQLALAGLERARSLPWAATGGEIVVEIERVLVERPALEGATS